MSATVVSDPISAAAAPESQTSLKMNNQIELEFAKCDCCGLTEECTLAYIARIRERFQGRWICGLCAEAVKDEIYRSEMFISMEEALNLHKNFCKKFSSSAPTNPTEHLIAAMRQLLKRSLDSPRILRSNPNSPCKKEEGVRRPQLSRTGSCFSTLARRDKQ